ncbi:hypothetical protein ACIBAC_15085 [Streptomyces sp. NPDC051362]|uniref:hypothetical protein n=1 Tax=Streptomyces sp. NPDC051362 TaxID=3365651 RepID=UPI00378A0011
MTDAAEVVLTVAAALAATTTFGAYLARRDRAAQADRDLLRLARRKDRPRMNPAPLAIDERSPDWCHRHGCPRGACPGPE